MSKKPLILGIESSCDETAASLITENEEGSVSYTHLRAHET